MDVVKEVVLETAPDLDIAFVAVCYHWSAWSSLASVEALYLLYSFQ